MTDECPVNRCRGQALGRKKIILDEKPADCDARIYRDGTVTCSTEKVCQYERNLRRQKNGTS